MSRRSVCLGMLVGTACLSLFSAAVGQQPRMTPERLWQLGRLGEAAVSADGQRIAYAVRHYDLANNSGRSSLLVFDRGSTSTTTVVADWRSIGSLQYAPSPLGERLYFVGVGPPQAASTDAAASPPVETLQAFVVEPAGLPQPITHLDGGIANLKVAPTGRHIAFTRDVKLDPTVNELYPDLPKAEGRIIDSLMFRHWDSWHDFSYSHVHVAPLDDRGLAGDPIDLMPELRADCPLLPFGGAEQFAWSPDGRELALTLKIETRWAESTNSDVYLASADSSQPLRNISAGNAGYDNDPVYSPDGKYLAFHSMERGGFEADRRRVMLYDRKSESLREATEGLDQSAHGTLWSPDGQRLFYGSETEGTDQVFATDRDRPGAAPLTEGDFNWSLVAAFPDGQRLLVKRESMIRPAELAILSLEDRSLESVSHINDAAFAELALPTVRSRWITSTDGAKVHCWVIYPPDFDESKSWPMLLYCQGGPQSQIGQWFSFRWNFHLMAAQGYVVLAPNRRGLPGFGQKWNDDISGDWGGQAMRDLLAATDDLSQEPYIDRARRAAVGASFGGYTVYWLMGNHEDRFSAMIAHCGVFNLESMYGATEELFFVNWDLGGPYWRSAEIQSEYTQFSPHRFVGNWKTPLLVVHGERDYRVPVTQGMEAFTAAQVEGIPSRFLYFPGEGHWVNSPQNSVLWQRVFFDWLDRYCKTPTP